MRHFFAGCAAGLSFGLTAFADDEVAPAPADTPPAEEVTEPTPPLNQQELEHEERMKAMQELVETIEAAEKPKAESDE